VSARRDSNNAPGARLVERKHVMETCGHAAPGVLLSRIDICISRSSKATIKKKSDTVNAKFDSDTQTIEIRQAQGNVETTPNGAFVAEALVSACSVESHHHARERKFEMMATFCDALNSTGPCLLAIDAMRPPSLHGRQYARSSGYPDDATAEIVATAQLYAANATTHSELDHRDRPTTTDAGSSSSACVLENISCVRYEIGSLQHLIRIGASLPGVTRTVACSVALCYSIRRHTHKLREASRIGAVQ
jgi:hypothetical protein